MKEICWQCGKKLALPYFAEVKDYDGGTLRVHKICKPAAELVLRPSNFGEIPAEGATPQCRDSDNMRSI